MEYELMLSSDDTHVGIFFSNGEYGWFSVFSERGKQLLEELLAQ